MLGYIDILRPTRSRSSITSTSILLPSLPSRALNCPRGSAAPHALGSSGGCDYPQVLGAIAKPLQERWTLGEMFAVDIPKYIYTYIRLQEGSGLITYQDTTGNDV